MNMALCGGSLVLRWILAVGEAPTHGADAVSYDAVLNSLQIFVYHLL